jgi:2-amino-4-hydroxy-6-hydroxymethyldihydropteridine diphosphokinase
MSEGGPKGSGRRVAIGLGSNRPHGCYGRPDAVVRAAAALLARSGIGEARLSPVIATRPMGPAQRRFANAALVGVWEGGAADLLALLKAVEQRFGRRPARRWGPRVIDCDLLLIEAERIATRALRVPHRGLAGRRFVLEPLARIWPEWRHPETGLSVRQMLARLNRRRALRPDAAACR